MTEAYPPDVREFVQQVIANGDYSSEEDVVIAAVRALRDLKQWRSTSLEADDIASAWRGVSQMEAGQGRPFTEVDSDIRNQHGFSPRR